MLFYKYKICFYKNSKSACLRAVLCLICPVSIYFLSYTLTHTHTHTHTHSLTGYRVNKVRTLLFKNEELEQGLKASKDQALRLSRINDGLEKQAFDSCCCFSCVCVCVSERERERERERLCIVYVLHMISCVCVRVRVRVCVCVCV